MLAILIATAAALPPVWGLGHLVARRIGAPDVGLAVTGLLGLGALAILGTTIHLFAPVGPWVAAAVLLGGLASFAWNARRIVGGAHPAVLVAMAAVLAGLSAASGLPSRHYDMGLYWLQAMSWTTESAQPLGLATLHFRLGFNSTWFTAAALLEHPLAVGKSAFVAPALVVLLGAWLSAEGVLELARGRRTLAALLAASSACLAAACVQHLGGHSPDVAAAVIGFASLVSWARAFERDEAFRENAAVAIALACVATSVKVSSVVWLAAAPLMLVLRRDRVRGDLVTAARVAAAFLSPWILHGYLASGCPLFPSSIGCVPVPWATPAGVGANVSAWIRSWARTPGRPPSVVLASWDWLPGWWERASSQPELRVLASLVVLGAVGVSLARGRASPGFWRLLAVSAAGVAFWFQTAPTARFGWAYLFALALVPCAEAIAKLSRRHLRWPVLAAGAVALVAVWRLAAASVAWVDVAPGPAISPVAWPRMPGAPWKDLETASGLRVQVPVRGDQCWSAPVPCTPYFDAGLSFDGRIFRSAPPGSERP